MGKRGRPGKGLGHVDGLEGGEVAKDRQKAILATLFGERTVRDASKELGLSEARVRTLRAEALQAMLDSLEPRSPGRPPKEEEPIDPSDVETLRQRVRELEFDLQVARTRTEIAMTMPHVLKDRPEPETGKGGGSKRPGKPPWFRDTTKHT